MGFRTTSFDRCLLSSCLAASLLMTACFPTPPTPSILPTCGWAPTANPYNSQEIIPKVNDIYQKSFNDLGSARQSALFQLGQNVEYWSAQTDVINDASHMVRITVTYLDPILVQYIVLNHMLSGPNYINDVVNSPMRDALLPSKIQTTLQQLSLRGEMLFVVTITSPFQQSQVLNSPDLTVKFPVNEMMLNSASYTKIKPTHFDRILDQNMDITHGPVSGIVGYPIALVQPGENCTLIIDHWTTTLTVDIPSITLGSVDSSNRFWSIPYRSSQSDNHPTPTPDPFFLGSPVNKLNQPPTPSWTPMPGSNNTKYWEEMGRYLWNVVVNQTGQ